MYSSSLFSALSLALAYMHHSTTASAAAAPQGKQAHGSKLSATCSGVWTDVHVDGNIIPQSR